MTTMMIYITASDGAEAKRIGRELVEARLIACANVIGAMTPIFRWEGEVREGSEAILIAKTSQAMSEKVVEAVRASHSYDCPAVVALPIAHGNPAFLEWIHAEVGGETAPKASGGG